jgi:hypothetical protein
MILETLRMARLGTSYRVHECGSINWLASSSRLDGLPLQKPATLGGLDPFATPHLLKLCHFCFIFFRIVAQFMLLYLCVTTTLMLRAVSALDVSIIYSIDIIPIVVF